MTLGFLGAGRLEAASTTVVDAFGPVTNPEMPFVATHVGVDLNFRWTIQVFNPRPVSKVGSPTIHKALAAGAVAEIVVTS